MPRLIILLALAGLAWWLWRHVSQKLTAGDTSRPSSSRSQQSSQKLVACEHCQVHIPEGDAYTDHDCGKTVYFCSPEHQTSWQQQRD
ncbi:conserved hypothetical protein [gamma proteobacterium HTCC5015]|nr:conserved hypothetical protein [gamma proteobacterium HTCC5015]